MMVRYQKASKDGTSAQKYCGLQRSLTKKQPSSSANVKGQPNLTCGDFCQWLNNNLLSASCLEPSFPRKTLADTERKWMHHLGFEPLSSSKCMYFDGHERVNIVISRNDFVHTMCKIGFLHPEETLTVQAQRAFPTNIPLVSSEEQQKTIIIFHDETTFNATRKSSGEGKVSTRSCQKAKAMASWSRIMSIRMGICL